IEQRGGTIELESRVRRLIHDGGRITTVEIERGGGMERADARALLSTMPLRKLVEALSPPAPPAVRAAAAQLQYRDFITVALIIDAPHVFPDNWIYVHDEQVKLGRVQNFKNWSPEMVPDEKMTCLGLEYFCFEGDGLWTMADRDLIELGTREMARVRLISPSQLAAL